MPAGKPLIQILKVRTSIKLKYCKIIAHIFNFVNLKYSFNVYLLFKYSSIDFAAVFPAPIARITVAAPVTASPPA